MQQFVKDLRNLVAANRPKLVLAVLTDFFEKYSADFHQQTLMVQANLSQTEREQATGVLSAVEARQSFAKINASLLYLIDAIPSCSSDAATAIARAQEIDRAFREVEPALIAPVNNRSSWIWLAILALLAQAGGLCRTINQPLLARRSRNHHQSPKRWPKRKLKAKRGDKKRLITANKDNGRKPFKPLIKPLV